MKPTIYLWTTTTIKEILFKIFVITWFQLVKAMTVKTVYVNKTKLKSPGSGACFRMSGFEACLFAIIINLCIVLFVGICASFAPILSVFFGNPFAVSFGVRSKEPIRIVNATVRNQNCGCIGWTSGWTSSRIHRWACSWACSWASGWTSGWTIGWACSWIHRRACSWTFSGACSRVSS